MKRRLLWILPALLLLAGGADSAIQYFKLSGGKGILFQPSLSTITSGSGAPTAAAKKGSLYLRKDGDPDTSVYLNGNGNTSWNAIQTTNPTFTSVVSTTEVTARHLLMTGGTAVASTDVTLTGWGASAAKAVTSGARDSRGIITVTTNASDTASANPTVKLTFKGPSFSLAPVVMAAWGSDSTGPVKAWSVASTTADATFTYPATPTATSALTYILYYWVVG